MRHLNVGPRMAISRAMSVLRTKLSLDANNFNVSENVIAVLWNNENGNLMFLGPCIIVITEE